MIDLTDHAAQLTFFGSTNIKILFVVDSTIRTVETPTAFGIGRVVRLIDNLSRGCSSFSVDTARRDPFPGGLASPQNQGHISTSFEFDDTVGGTHVIDRYDQIWLFGLHSENSGPVVSNSELAALTRWMDQGGGLFATGDHATLGASMCAGIPRVREMRRWTNADLVPPGSGPTRLDTNRPTNGAESTGMAPIAFEHERDATSQVIDWIPVSSVASGLVVHERPHEILCHPQLGPIDVMPDHPHEGRTKELSEVDLSRTYNFGDGVSGSDFPAATSPQLIARGQTVAAPPTSKPYKGPCSYFDFPMISVYDGRSAGIKGRVATDSTWHHWFDLNIYGLETAADDTDWKKISRYFENLAVWLSPPGRFRSHCWFVHQWLEYPLVEEIDLREIHIERPPVQLGGLVRGRFQSIFGPCTTTRIAWESICDWIPWLCKALVEFDPRVVIDPPIGPQCLSCPPFDRLEEAIFEGFMMGTITFMEEFGPEQLMKLSDERADRALAAHMAPAVEASVKRYALEVTTDLERTLKTWSRVRDGGKPKRSRKKPAKKSAPKTGKAG